MAPRKEHKTEDGIEKRWCGKCKGYRPLDNFGYSKNTWDNLRSTCKVCLHQYNVEVAESRTEYNKQYWQDTKEEQSEKSKKWREANPEKVKEGMKRWLEENKEHKKQKDKEYREAHKDQYRETQRKWYRENYKKLKEEGGEKFIAHKLKSNMGRRIREILGQDKSERCVDYVGCSIEELRSHLETTFKEDMTWENYGSEWHIDHRLPCASFNMLDENERMACFYYKNLQALWAAENIRKKDSYDPEEKKLYLELFNSTCPLAEQHP